MADWMVWKDKRGRLQVSCSECKYQIPPYQMIPDCCPKCGVRMESECEWKKYKERKA